jgi:hypothetical protein
VRVLGGINGQWQVGVEFAQEEPRTGITVDQVGMFPYPSQAGLLRDRFFENRGAIDKYPVAEFADILLDTAGQRAQAAAQDLVVVAAECISRYVCLVSSSSEIASA